MTTRAVSPPRFSTPRAPAGPRGKTATSPGASSRSPSPGFPAPGAPRGAAGEEGDAPGRDPPPAPRGARRRPPRDADEPLLVRALEVVGPGLLPRRQLVEGRAHQLAAELLPEGRFS